MAVNKTRADIVNIGVELIEKKLVASTWGNISARINDTLVAITPSGRNYLTLRPEDIVVLDLQGNIIDGSLKPSSELMLHLAIYNQRRDVKAIVHTHSVFASACAVAQKSIPPIIEDLVQMIGGGVDVAQYALPGTQKLAENAVKALQHKNAVLLANHGMVGCGQNLNEAFTACELVEKAAQIFIYANMLGGPVVLSKQDVDVMHEFYLKHYRLRQGGEKE